MSYLQTDFFLALLALGLAAYISSPRLRPGVVLTGSLLFYATWSLPCLYILLASIGITYVAGLQLAAATDEGRRKLILIGSIAVLLGSLVAFKTLEVVPPDEIGGNWRWLIPMGVSYYTFKAISYLLEVHWESIKPQRDPVKLALYISFFPQIVSGPIQRPDDFFEQLDRPGSLKPGADAIVRALPLLILGAFEKLVVADRIGPLVAGLDAQTGHAAGAALLADYGYTLQLFADFAGLTHVALGLGALFGIIGPPNFNLPFSARSIPDFWRRWHMSLTFWLGDYLFLPLRMSLRGLGARGLQLSLLINMMLIGVWHGFRATYLAFGIYHGILLAVSTMVAPKIDGAAKRNAVFGKLHRWIAPLVTFHLIVLGQLFFRAPSLAFVWDNLRRIVIGDWFGVPVFGQIDPAISHVGIVAMVIALGLGTGVLAKVLKAVLAPLSKNEAVRWGALGVLALVVMLAASKSGGQFMYARF